MLRKIIVGALLGVLLAGSALAQSIQLDPGQVLGNDTAAARNGRAASMSAMLDRSFGAPSVQGCLLTRGAALYTCTRTPTLGLAGTATGTLTFAGVTSGGAILSAQAAAGTPTLLLPTGSGTLASTATAPLVLSATTGALTCPTCVTSSSGGAITGTAPIAVSGAGAVSITGLAGAVLAGSGPAFTRTPVLGVAGSVVGDLGFQNATSGTVTIRPVTGALGSPVILMPAASGTMAVSATAPITLSAAGAIGVTGAALTRTDDTNVTLTLGGTPATALLQATSLTLGWTGQLSVARGGTGLASGTSGGVLYYSAAGTLASSAALGANQIVIGGGAGVAPSTFACATSTTVVHGGTPPTCSQIVFGDLASALLASNANYLSGAANVLIQPSIIYQAEVDLGNSGSGTQVFDFVSFINARTTMTGNITTQTLSNVTAGKAGTITFIQDGTVPALSTAINTVDVLTYSCRSSTFCVAALIKDVRNP